MKSVLGFNNMRARAPNKTLTWQDLRDVDRKLALNIERFYSDYKTSIDSSR